MRSTFHGLEVSKRALFAQQTAISTTGHNIANANTRGYSRQTVNMASSYPLEAPGANRGVSPGQLGTGVDVTSIHRIREGFLDQQYWTENQRNGEYEQRAKTLERLEGIFNEPADNGSLSAIMHEMWGSWNGLANDSSNPATQEVVLGSLKNVSDALNLKARQLSDLKTNISSSLEMKAQQANGFIERIQNLNDKIITIEALGDNANDLRDQRDIFVDDLSKLINVKVKEEANGSYSISMMDQTNTLVPIIDQSNTIVITTTTTAAVKASASGELFGLSESIGYVDNYTLQLDALAETLADTLNLLHNQGNSGTAPDLFTSSDGNPITAATIRIAITSSDEISSSVSGAAGDGSLARDIHNLKDDNSVFPSNQTFDEYYRSLAGGLGVEAKRAYEERDNMKFIVENLDNSRMSVSAVSLDEEMSNLIKFQHAYNAAARQITVVDEMLDKIINGMGIVGR